MLKKGPSYLMKFMPTEDWDAELDAIHLKDALNSDISATDLIASS